MKRLFRPSRAISLRLGALVVSCALIAGARPTAATELGKDCTSVDDDARRLACYDLAHGRHGAGRPAQHLGEASAGAGSAPDESSVARPATGSPLAAVWELGAENKRGSFRLLPHRSNYFLPLRYGDRPNAKPSSPAPDHSVASALPVDTTEAKFQFSFKTKAWENVLGSDGDLWLAFTQQSNWQMFNSSVSSPFRETNYEPEVILSLHADSDVLGWHWRVLNLGFVHQSNGRPLPVSRSWNRVYAQFGLERDRFTLLARPWIRVPEKADSDDNPDVRDYLGSGDLRLGYVRAGHVYSVLARYSASGKRGALQFDWAYPISGALKGYVQVTSGYGESLIDYNHSQNTLGIGLLFVPWR